MGIVLSLITRINSCNNKDFYQTIELTIMLSVKRSLLHYQAIKILRYFLLCFIVYKMVPV